MFRSTNQKRISCVVFTVYFALLIWLVLFKFATELSAVPQMRHINWIPFCYDLSAGIYWKEILSNWLVFIPLGVYLQIFKGDRKFAATCAMIFGVSFLFECLQFIFGIGVSDITDLLGNTFGGVCGIGFCRLLKKLAPEKYIGICNIAGAVIELTAIGLMLLLLAANT